MNVMLTSIPLLAHGPGTISRAAGLTPMNPANTQLQTAPDRAPTMGKLGKISYTHQDMIDYIIANPGCSGADLAGRYGYSESWISNIRSSDAWKAAYAKRRAEVLDPGLVLSIQERMESLTVRAHEVLMEKLDKPNVADNTVLKAFELGARGVNAGNQNGIPLDAADHLARLASRLVSLQKDVRTGVVYENEVTEASVVSQDAQGQ